MEILGIISACMGALCFILSSSRLCQLWKETNKVFKARQFCYLSAFALLLVVGLTTAL